MLAMQGNAIDIVIFKTVVYYALSVVIPFAMRSSLLAVTHRIWMGAGMDSKKAFRFAWQPYIVAIAVIGAAVQSGTLAVLLTQSSGGVLENEFQNDLAI